MPGLKAYIYPLILAFGIFSCDRVQESNIDFPYDLTKEDNNYLLPRILDEISGLAFAGNNNLYCIQDELGTIFIYSITQKEIISEIVFGGKQDYEGLAKDRNVLYALTSDATIYKISNPENKNYSVQIIKPGLSNNCNAEGITFDKKSSRLIVGCKELVVKDNNGQKSKILFILDSADYKASNEKSLLIRQKELSELSGTKSRISEMLPQMEPLDFWPSGLAIHPLTGDLYILSARSHQLLIMSGEGKLNTLIDLNPLKFRQAEGITFANDGTLYIANEAQNGRANIKEFHYQPK